MSTTENITIDNTLNRLTELADKTTKVNFDYDGRGYEIYAFVVNAFKQGILDSMDRTIHPDYLNIVSLLKTKIMEYRRENQADVWEMFNPKSSTRFAYLAYLFGNAYYQRMSGNNLAAELLIALGILGLSDVSKNAPIAAQNISHELAGIGLQDIGQDKLDYCLALEDYLLKEGILNPTFTTKKQKSESI